MNATGEIILKEIQELIELSSNFKDRFTRTEQNVKYLPFDLYNDLLYFCERATHIFKSTNKINFFELISKFSFTHVKLERDRYSNIYIDFMEVLGALSVVRKEVEKGLLYKISDLIKAEVFANFLESAKYFLDSNHKIPAAVIIGGVLEDELRNLCDKNGIATKNTNGKSLTTEPMNVELTKAGIYNSVIKLQITTWADVRNHAAHGRYDEFTNEQVEKMYDFVLNFKP